MSQITQHILDPYNVHVLTPLEKYALESSIANELNALSLYDAFGFGECGSWDITLKRYLILDMFTCTAATTLNQTQLQCLVGAAFDGLDRNIPCDTNIYKP